MKTLLASILVAGSSALAGMHPAFPLLDGADRPVLESGNRYSPTRTCGACHDATFIDHENPHAGLGADLVYEGAPPADALPWETGDGPFGRWDPLRYDAPPRGARADASWVSGAMRHAGGGPALELGSEHDCLLCHLTAASATDRRAALAAGDFAWAASATLAATGLVERADAGWRWLPDAFPEGQFPVDRLPMTDPDDMRCGQCHGLVQQGDAPLLLKDAAQWRRDPSGLVWSAQRASDSGLNLAGKEHLDRSWDVHAERLLGCTDCHASVNNPAHRREDADSRPAHLLNDARRASVSEYLERPSHRLAGGPLSRASGGNADLDCRGCHDARVGHSWLPSAERHLMTIGCETCHIPALPAGARQLLDWTALDGSGQPLTTWHGAAADPASAETLLEGVLPLLVGQLDDDGRQRLRPLLVESVWLWVDGEPAAPVERARLTRVWQAVDRELPPLFDADGDGRLSDVERRLDTPQKTADIAARLVADGARQPRVAGSLRPVPLHHGTVRGEWALGDCAACHEAGGRVGRSLELAPYLPGGVMPVVIHDDGILADAPLLVDGDGALSITPPADLDGRRLYVLGDGRTPLIDWLGLLLLGGVVGGVVVHGGLRWRGRGKEKH